MSTRELQYTLHRSSGIDHYSAASSLTYRVTIAWPTAASDLMVTRSVNEGATVHAPSLIRNRPSLRCCLTDVSGYHSSLTYRVTIAWPTAASHPMVTRSVNEGAAVHAPSHLRNRPLLRCFLIDVSGYHYRVGFLLCGQRQSNGLLLRCSFEVQQILIPGRGIDPQLLQGVS